MRILKPLLKIAISLALVTIVMHAFDVKGVIAHFAKVDAVTLLLVIVIALSITLLHTLRWLAVVNANGSRLWVSNQSDGTVTELNTATNAVTRTLTVSGTPQDIVLSPDGAELYVANLAHGVQVWDVNTSTLVTTIPLQGGGFGLAMSPDGAQLYAAATLSGQVYVIDRTTREVIRILSVGGLPRRIAFSTKGDVAVFSNEAGSVAFVR